MLRGAMSPEMGRAEDVAKKIRIELEMRGLHKEPLGIDIIEPPVLFALQREGIKVVDGQQLMSECPRHQNAGRNRTAQHFRDDGRRRLRRTLPRHEARHCARTKPSAWSAKFSTISAPNTSRR